jgi:two-component system, NtrC family, C4-dicarboxylate transport sensor histidine kinase DctB
VQQGATSPRVPARSSLRRLIWVAIAATLILTAVLTYQQAFRVFLADMDRRSHNTLVLANTSLAGYLDRFERLPHLLADQPQIVALSENPDDPQRVAVANAYLEEVTSFLGASDIYFMDASGLTRAASNHAAPASFIGGNFAFRPYFSDAMTQGAGRFYALGTTSLKRGYYFGAPVHGAQGLAGVLALKIDLDYIESTWAAAEYALMVTDPEGVVFLSSRPEWLFSMTRQMTPASADQLARTRRYADETLARFPQSGESRIDGFHVLNIDKPEAGKSGEYLFQTLPMPKADWTLWVLQDIAPARQQALTVAAGALLALALGIAAAMALFQRRARLRDRLLLQAAAQAELEGRVTERTRELAQLNQTLNAEVAERRQAENNLRQAQADLIQAAKLAALGQMSAALSHEFNQPLGALRNYAENAQVLLDRDRKDEVRDTLGRILAMADRMTAIGKHLRSFARKPGQKLAPVDLAEVVAVAAEIARLRLKSAGAELIVDLAEDLPRAVAGPVRLQQVLVNLISNAADAVQDLPDRRIHLSAFPTETGVAMTVRDHGPGVPDALSGRIFDPFFSTKGVGNGLGLGLSISYNIMRDFGGTLSQAPAPGGGAVFRLDLRRASDAAPMAAE